MSKQPEALRLADELEMWTLGEPAAAELRRQHEENEGLRRERDEARRTVREAHEAGTRLTAQRDALLAALKELTGHANERFSGGVWDRARAAIKAVEGEHMTDREYLEFAAKAAGIVGEYESWTYQGFNEGIRQVLNGIKCWKPWNPLTDDGDAFRLMVNLALDVDCDIAGGQTTVNGDFGWVSEMHSPDPLAATRRAIVRAAAELGRSMK